MSADRRWPKDFITVCKRMAKPGTFEHRQRKHNTISFTYRGEVLRFSFPQTPSCHRSFTNMMETFSSACNDNGWPDDKVFRGKRAIRAACRRRNEQ
jgi:hypothetical protein